MAKFEKGFLGGFSGKVGNAVGSSWRNFDILKSRPPRKRKGEASAQQLEIQSKFALLTEFLRPLTPMFDVTFKKSAAGKMSGFNKAFSENKRAVTGDYPAISIDYSKVLLSAGSLHNADAPTATSAEAGKLVFTWTDNSDGIYTLISDLVFVAVYNEELKRWVQNPNIATRNAGTCTLNVTAFSGKPAQTFIGFMSADRKKVSKSLYTGLVNIL